MIEENKFMISNDSSSNRLILKVDDLVENMQRETIWYDSTQNQCSTFYFSLPQFTEEQNGNIIL
ncbi:MAG: hypothetical protein ABFD00_02380 [Chloroherpetonaceae bacterium]